MTTARKASSAKPSAVIVLTGVEELLIRGELERLVRENVTPDTRDFDFNEFRASDLDPGTLWNALITLPLLAGKRVVILHLTGEPRDDLRAVLNRYSAKPSATTLLIIVQVFEERGTPLSLEGDVRVLSFSTMSRHDQRTQWAQEYVRKRGKELLPEAAEYVVSISSSRLTDLAAKLEHAMLYVGDAKEITGKALMQVSGVTSEYLLWQLEDPILERHATEVFKRASSLEAGGEELLRLLASQRSFLLRIWRVGALARKLGIRRLDKNSKELLFSESQAILGNRAFKSGDLCQAYWNIGETRVRLALEGLLELEVQIKTGRSGWRGYYDWVWKLISTSPIHGTSNIT